MTKTNTKTKTKPDANVVPAELTVTIDGNEYKAARGQTILEAALENDVYIPNLCYHPDLSPFGGCRLCIVEVEGMRGYPTACTTPVTDGMKVRTNTDELQNLRRSVFQFIISEHPYTCLVCGKKDDCADFQTTTRKVGIVTGCQYCPSNGQCELQDLVEYLDVCDMPIPITYRGLMPEMEDPFFDRDYNLCILCGRCVRVCNEVRLNGTMTFTHRGDRSLVGTAFGLSHMDTECEFCGACVDVCPTGALSDRRSKWEGKPDRGVDTTCPYCSTGCILTFQLKDDRIVKSVPSREGEVNRGQACVRGRFGVLDMVYNKERITSPMIRKGEELIPVPWAEALEYTARHLEKYRGSQFAMIGSSYVSNEDNYALQKFARLVMKSNNVDFPNSIPRHEDTRRVISHMKLECKPIISAIEEAGSLLMVGTNLRISNPIVGLHMRHAEAKGSRIISTTPREAGMCKTALRINPRPGTAYLWVSAIARAVIEGNLYQPEVSRTPGFEELNVSLFSVPFNDLVKWSGVDGDMLREIAKTLAERPPAMIMYGLGVTSYTTAAWSIEAICNLAMLLGGHALPAYQSCNFLGSYDMGLTPDFLPGYAPVSDEKARARFEEEWGGWLSPSQGLYVDQLGENVKEGLVKAMYVVGDAPLAREELEGLEFLVLQNTLPCPLMDVADVVLPGTSSAEANGSFTNQEGRVQPVRRTISPIGDSRPDWLIVTNIAQEMSEQGFDYRFDRLRREIAAMVPAYTPLTDWAKSDAEKSFRRHFMDLTAPEFGVPQLTPMELEDAPPIYEWLGSRAGSLDRWIKGMRRLKEREEVKWAR